MSASFVHLHLHSEYSLCDSTIRIPELVKACVRSGMPAVALTDESNLFALIRFYKACESAGIKPIIGMDLILGMHDGKPQRATMLCADREGYLNLSNIISRAYRNRSGTGEVIVPSEWLTQSPKGLFALLGNESMFGMQVLGGRDDLAMRELRDWQSAFGDRLYLELTRTGHAEEDHFIAHAVDLADTLDLPCVASNNVRFLTQDEFEAHEARVCIHAGYVLNDPKRPKNYRESQYLKSPQEMRERFADLPGAIDNTIELAKRCNVELSLGKPVLPAFPTGTDASEANYLRELSRQGLEQRFKIHPPINVETETIYRERLERELGVIDGMGFPGYFLIVADFINWAKQNDIPVGPGRGSGAGSLVAYALNITDIDPLPYDLLFERFLNPERVSMPDFDIDFCMDRRDEVIDYVARKYGRERVSQIITFGTMAAKAAVRDSGRVLGMSYGHVDSVAKLIPLTLGISLDDALGESAAAKKNPDLASAELIARYQNEDEVRELLDLARKLEDLTRNAGKHAGGVVISPGAITEFAPLFCEPGGDGVVTQFDKDDVETAGLVKFDFLGLRTLTIIDWAVKSINQKRKARGEDLLDIILLPLNDVEVYKLFSRAETVAVFQFESRGMRELIKRARPDCFEDIIALAALFRPGPLGSGMDKDWVNRKHGEAQVTYPHPLLEPVLAPTYGVIVYQEQVMQIAQVLAGYSLGGADLLRRAMGKKKAEEMAKERAKFEQGCADRGIASQTATSIFDLMEKFAEYGFNKSHSAAYALVAYQTAWLKVHHPAEFMAATLSSDMDNTDKVVNFLDETRAMGIQVLPPDVNSSIYQFTAMDTKTIRYGLGAIKGVGRAVCDDIVRERNELGPFRDMLDLCNRIDPQKLNKRVLEALVNSGAADSLARNRATIMHNLAEVVRAAEQRLRDVQAGQHDMFGGGGAMTPITLELEDVADWPMAQKLNGERDTLGFYLSGHPMDEYRTWLKEMTSCTIAGIEKTFSSLPNSNDRRAKETTAMMAGQVLNLRKRGDSMAFVQLDDGTGRLEVALFREAFEAAAPLLSKDAILIVEGGLVMDEFSGGFSLRARNVWTLAEATARHARLVRVKVNGINADFIAHLQRALRPHGPGATPVRLEYENQDALAEVDLGEQLRVRASPDLISSLRGVPGVKNADLSFAR